MIEGVSEGCKLGRMVRRVMDVRAVLDVDPGFRWFWARRSMTHLAADRQIPLQGYNCYQNMLLSAEVPMKKQKTDTYRILDCLKLHGRHNVSRFIR